ncbi:unnamed protein product [Fusarium fujikuroi]|nr:unnamed protein product [Fusarium fujikuroi]
MNAEKLRSIGQSLIAVADGHRKLDDSLKDLFDNLPDCILQLIYDKIKSVSGHQLVTESGLHRGSTDKHNEHISRNEHYGDGAESNARADGDRDTSQDERCLTTCEAPLLTADSTSGALVGIEEKSQGEELFEVQPGHSQFLDEWAKSPDTFFNGDNPTKLDVGIYQFVINLENSQDLNAIKLRYTFRQLYLSRKSWGRYQTEEFNETLLTHYTKSQESKIRTWLKEGHLYDLLCTEFGIGCLFCDVVSRPDARKLSLPKDKKHEGPAYRKLLRYLDRRKLGAVSEKYKTAADNIASYMEHKQIEAGLLRVPKRPADGVSRDPRETRSKKVCRRNSPDQPSCFVIQDSTGNSHVEHSSDQFLLRQSTVSITQDSLTYGTSQESAGTGTEMVADDDGSGDGIDGHEPPNAALGLRNDQLSIPSPLSTSYNLLQRFPENNAMLSSPKTTAATMSTTSTPSPAPNTDAETQPRRGNSLSDRLQTEIQRPDTVSGAPPLGSSFLLGDGSPLSGLTASSHTDISSASASTPDKFNAIPSQQQSSHEQPQNSQLHVDDLHTSQQSTIIGHMDMEESIAGVSAPASELLPDFSELLQDDSWDLWYQ